MTTEHATRLYALLGALFVFFLTCAVIAARPWPSAAPRPAAAPVPAGLVRYEERLRRDAALVARLQKLQTGRRAALAAAAPVAPRVVSLPPVTVTRTS